MILKTKHFDFFFDDVDTASAQRFSELAEETVKKVSGELGISPDIERQEFYICPDVKSFIRLTNRTEEDYQTWMVGWANRDLRRICLLSPRGVTDRPPDAMEKIAVHETVHIVFDQLADPEKMPAWISEGAAVLYADQTEPQYIDENNCPSIFDISGYDFAENGGYDYSGVYVWYFIKCFGMNAFKELYRGEYRKNWYRTGFEAQAVREYKRDKLNSEEK